MAEIEQILLNFVSHNTPNSKYPVLVYRNVLSGSMVDPSLDEASRQEHTKKLFQTNNWRPEKVYPSITHCHYHPNVHEAYAVIQGSSTLVLGLDIAKEPLDAGANYAEVNVSVGDVIVIPAGVSHRSKAFDEDYRYLAAYPREGEKWKSISNKQMLLGSEQFDAMKYLAMATSVAVPGSDPVYEKGGLLDIWKASC